MLYERTGIPYRKWADEFAMLVFYGSSAYNCNSINSWRFKRVHLNNFINDKYNSGWDINIQSGIKTVFNSLIYHLKTKWFFRKNKYPNEYQKWKM